MFISCKFRSRLIEIFISGAEIGTTANKGTRGSLVRMRPDVVYYSWAVIDIEYLKVSESIWILTLDQNFF